MPDNENQRDAVISVIYHSGLGHTSFQAKAVRDGAASVSGTDVDLVFAADVDDNWDRLHASDALIFGCPTYMGSASAEFKRFMDSTSRIWLEQGWKDKIAGGFTNSGNLSGDKLSTLYQLVTFAMQHGMIWIGLDLPGGGNYSTSTSENLNRIGGWIGAMAQSNTDQGIDGMLESDLLTAHHLGMRIASYTSDCVARKA